MADPAVTSDLDIALTDVDGKLILSDGHSSITLEGAVRDRFREQLERFYAPASRYVAFLAGFLAAASIDFKRDKGA